MNRTLSNVLIFAVGAAIGSAATWYFVKTKYERIAQEEIDSVKEEFSKQNYTGPQDSEEVESQEQNNISEEEDVEPEPVRPSEKRAYHELTQKLGYVGSGEAANVNATSILEPDALGELGYQIVELTYWADDILTDTKNKRIKNPDELIGKGTLSQFGKYEEDALHVRNHDKKIDFEILRDLKRYSDFFDVDSPDQTEE